MPHGVTKEARGRNFAFVQKIEYLPEDWEEKLKELLIPLAVILHDKDTDENGELVDPHIHVFLYFSGKKTVSGVLGLLSDFNVSHVEKIECKNAYLAYMLHLRRPAKHLYGFDELHIYNGLKVNYADLSEVDFGDVLEYCHIHGIKDFAVLIDATRKSEPPIFRYVTSHYALCCAYFDRKRERYE